MLTIVSLSVLMLTQPQAAAPVTTRAAEPAFRIGELDATIRESSGLVASRRQNGVFWTHPDSGNPAELFAVARDGRLLKSFPIAAPNIDWEDLAIDDKGGLYLADIGNNLRRRNEVFVRCVAEPIVSFDATATPSAPIEVLQTWTLRYSKDRPFDAEALVVVGGKGYVIPKIVSLGRVPIYTFDLDPKRPVQTLVHVGDLPVRFPVTAADVSADGRWLAVLTVAGPYLFEIDGDVLAATTATPRHVRYLHPKMEASALVPEGVLATTEERDVLLFRWADFGVMPRD